MKRDKCVLRISRWDYDRLMQHLFPGDHDEHGAVLLAGVARLRGRLVLCVREVHPAIFGSDYVEGQTGYRALSPPFIHRLITRARDERLAYLAVHNHGSDREVSFSSIDMASHERGYPALLQINRSVPVGALVFGRRSVQADIWLEGGGRLDLEEAVVVGSTVERLTPAPRVDTNGPQQTHDRQVRMLGRIGNNALRRSRVAVIGLGGVGSIVTEYLSRLGVGDFLLIDPDRLEESNLSRVVGAASADARLQRRKLTIARRVIRQANPSATVSAIADDVARVSVANRLANCDYLFLAADSMRARLVVNAVVNQYLVPGVQLGAKVRAGATGNLVDVMSVNRPMRPGKGCLWCNQLVDPTLLAQEAKSDTERREQAYGVEEPNPSVISLNAVAAAHGVNDFLFDFLHLRPERETLHYEEFHFLSNRRNLVAPRQNAECSECGPSGKRYARADSVELPCIE